MENDFIMKKLKLRENNSYFCINNTPKMVRLSATPVLMSNITKKHIQPINKLNNYDNKNVFKKKPYINFNFNVIQNKNMNNQKIRTITPNLRLREIVNKKIRENNNFNLNHYNNIKCKTELPDIFSINPNQNKSYINTDYNVKKKETNENIDRQLKLIFVMKNKINELNKIVKEKNQEINFLKNCEINYNTININKKEKKNNIINKKSSENYDIKKENKNLSKGKNINMSNNNMNTIKAEYTKLKTSKKENKDKIKDNKENNKIEEITKKYNETVLNNNKEIQNLKKMITDLEDKYQQELNKNKDMNQKYSFIRNCTFGLNTPQADYEKKLRERENKIIKLQEQIFQMQLNEQKKKIVIEDKNNKEKIILSDEEYFNIQICLNALIKKFNISEENIMKGINKISIDNIDKISNNICNLLKISHNKLICNFMNDYIIKNTENSYPCTLKELIKYDIFDENFIHNDLSSFLKERSIIYDYKKKGKIPIDYLRHIYKEFCFKNNRKENEKEFFHVIYTCKQHNYSSCLFDIFYDNLIIEDEEKDEKAVKNFIESILKEEFDKYNS